LKRDNWKKKESEEGETIGRMAIPEALKTKRTGQKERANRKDMAAVGLHT